MKAFATKSALETVYSNVDHQLNITLNQFMEQEGKLLMYSLHN